MSDNQFLKLLILGVFSIFWCMPLGIASVEKDPIKETQSHTVPVTQELLTREGEPAPASPTFKMSDTSGFLVKEPYEEADMYQTDLDDEEFSSDEWDNWFSWEE
ncbi:MAG: hypothetical protein HY585_01700 [Candidatus Omnitrophica bacterium]|nr:hypothetical protein [Candidatus Omnitrophota bacterium]